MLMWLPGANLRASRSYEPFPGQRQTSWWGGASRRGPRLGLRGPEAGGCRQLVTLPSSLGQASWGPAGLLFMQGGQGLGEAGEAQSRQVPSVIAFGHLKGIV